MAKRQREWARRERDRLHALLGGKCQHCGTDEALELDCKVPMGDRHHKQEWSARISFYRAMLTLGNLALLCSLCNRIKGAGLPLKWRGRTAWRPAQEAMHKRLADLRAKRKTPPVRISSAG